ncbi:kinase domain-containing protein [Polychaeton citri CBS 116435]|uniref:Kinase domain-containing protein n=1 Tax=Polychaeton citri CBS 116435 TaxID=1314669 RepID=A0A9P4QCX4_9PEZI|nr:kinase domain-containing protein [Polychaeton citri CBS 116435]
MPQPWRSTSKGRFLSVRSFSRKPAPLIPADKRIEEETLPLYEPQQYYPVHIGDIYQSKYRVAGKLGYGAYSTVWLCRDLWFVALKVSTTLRKHPDATHREYKIYEHLSNLTTTHVGQSEIRGLYDTFELQGSSGQHQCLLQPPMHMSLLDMMALNGEPFSVPLLKMTLQRLLSALDFLHTEAKVIHSDLKTDNLMLSIEDQTILDRFEIAEIDDPSPRKVIDNFPKPDSRKYGLPMLCDFGEARIGATQEGGPLVQPHIYRAPEVTFEMPWGPSIDIWNLACLAWDLLQGKRLFGDIFDGKGHHDPFKHLARMVDLIGPPPRDFVRRSETAGQCFDTGGEWRCLLKKDVVTRVAGREVEPFLQFTRSMLKWLPEERKTARELLQDPWLQA